MTRKGQTVVATVVLAVALGLVVLPFSAARGADDDIAKLIAEAKTASDHERIAAYYENEAKEAKVHVDKHKFESMAGRGSKTIYVADRPGCADPVRAASGRDLDHRQNLRVSRTVSG